MSGGEWLRVRRDRRCPVCEKADWCLVSSDGSAAICARVSDGAARQCGDAGWLHRLQDRDDWRRRVRTVRVHPACRPADLSGLAERCVRAVDAGELRRLAGGLGVSAESLQRLRIGWDGEAWTFPMIDAAGAVVGIRRRFADGRKLSVEGGHEGVFIPTDLSRFGPLLVCEGPTDTAALLDLGFSAIGRPSCSGGTRYVAEVARGRDVVIVADGDAPGQRGARILSNRLLLRCSDVRIITPPGSIKDARAWKRGGATHEDVSGVIQATNPLRISIQIRRTHGLAKGRT